MSNIIKEIKDLKRLREILMILIEEGLDLLVLKANLTHLIPFHKKLKHKLKKKPAAPKRVRIAIERLGGTFVKLGQLLSLRGDLIPFEYCKELQKLQDKVPTVNFKQVKPIIEKELNSTIKKTFKSFNEDPISGASIGQVYKAVLKNGKKVAVKVQRPKIEEKINSDIDILYFIARRLEKNKKFKKFRPLHIIQEFEEYTKKEMDYRNEAKNALIFKKNFKDSKIAYFPKPIKKYCTKRLLILEWIDGIELANTKKLKKTKLSNKKIAHNALYSMLKQVFEDGFFHGDSHPGNLFVLKDGKIAYVDFGITGKIDDELKKILIKLFIATLKKDAQKITDAIIELGDAPSDLNKEALKQDIEILLDEWHGKPLSESPVSMLGYKALHLALNYNIVMKKDLVLYSKAMVTIEGTGLKLYPNFNVVQEAMPYMRDLLIKQHTSFKNIKHLSEDAKDIAKFMLDLPSSTKKAMDKIGEGELNFSIETKEFKEIIHDVDKTVTNLDLGLISSAFVIAGAIIYHITQILGFIFFIIAIFLLGIVIIRTTHEVK